jgi:hypothetical protein
MLKGDVNIGVVFNKVFKEKQKITKMTVTSLNISMRKNPIKIAS